QGVSIGNDGISHPIVIGNTTSATGILLQSGSSGITSHAHSGQNYIYSANSAVDAIRIDSSLGGGGGIYLSSGPGGVMINNDGYANTTVIGNTVGTSNIIVQSGSGGILSNAN